MQRASFGAHTVAEVNRKGGRVRFGIRHADSRPLQSVERGTDRLQPAALSLCPPEEPPKTSAHDRPSQWCECRWCLNLSSLLQLLSISALFHSPEQDHGSLSASRIPAVRCGNVPRTIPTRELLSWPSLDPVSGDICGECDRGELVQLSWGQDRIPAASGWAPEPRPGDTSHRWATSLWAQTWSSRLGGRTFR